jgi:hypothetical protein
MGRYSNAHLIQELCNEQMKVFCSLGWQARGMSGLKKADRALDWAGPFLLDVLSWIHSTNTLGLAKQRCSSRGKEKEPVAMKVAGA